MRTKPLPIDDVEAFKSLPVEYISMGGFSKIAFHKTGIFSSRRPVITCLAGYYRNMSDFAQFTTLIKRSLGSDWPIVLIDLPGRGRSTNRRSMQNYTSVHDAHVVSAVLTSLCVEKTILVGQGHGGQTIMTLSAQRPTLISGAVLIDAGPLADPRGLVRMRNNLQHICATRSKIDAQSAMRQIFMTDHPNLDDPELDRLAARCFYFDKRDKLHTLFDPTLIRRLQQYTVDDIFEAQWGLFDTLHASELMFIRGQLSDQLRRETLEQMETVRPDAISITVPGQGSPVLLDDSDEVGAIADFVTYVGKRNM